MQLELYGVKTSEHNMNGASNLLEDLLVCIEIALHEEQRVALVGVLTVHLVGKGDEINSSLP